MVAWGQRILKICDYVCGMESKRSPNDKGVNFEGGDQLSRCTMAMAIITHAHNWTKHVGPRHVNVFP